MGTLGVVQRIEGRRAVAGIGWRVQVFWLVKGVGQVQIAAEIGQRVFARAVEGVIRAVRRLRGEAVVGGAVTALLGLIRILHKKSPQVTASSDHKYGFSVGNQRDRKKLKRIDSYMRIGYGTLFRS